MSIVQLLATLDPDRRRMVDPNYLAERLGKSPQELASIVYGHHKQGMELTSGGIRINYGKGNARALKLDLDALIFGGKPNNPTRTWDTSGIQDSIQSSPGGDGSKSNGVPDHFRQTGTISISEIQEASNFCNIMPEISYIQDVKNHTAMKSGFDIMAGDGTPEIFCTDSIVHDALGLFFIEAQQAMDDHGFVVLAVPQNILRWATDPTFYVPFEQWLENQQADDDVDDTSNDNAHKKQAKRKRDDSKTSSKKRTPSAFKSRSSTPINQGIANWRAVLPVRIVDPTHGMITQYLDGEMDALVPVFTPSDTIKEMAKHWRFIVHLTVDERNRPTESGKLRSPMARAANAWKRTVGIAKTVQSRVMVYKSRPMLICDTRVDNKSAEELTEQERGEIENSRRPEDANGMLADAAPSMLLNVQPSYLRETIFHATYDASVQDFRATTHATREDLDALQQQRGLERPSNARQIPTFFEPVRKQQNEVFQRKEGRTTTWDDLSLTQLDELAFSELDRPVLATHELSMHRHRNPAIWETKQYVPPEFDRAIMVDAEGSLSKKIAAIFKVPSSLLEAGKTGDSTSSKSSPGFKQASSATDGDVMSTLLELAVDHVRREMIALFDVVYRESLGRVFHFQLRKVLRHVEAAAGEALFNITMRQLYMRYIKETYKPVVDPNATNRETHVQEQNEHVEASISPKFQKEEEIRAETRAQQEQEAMKMTEDFLQDERTLREYIEEIIAAVADEDDSEKRVSAPKEKPKNVDTDDRATEWLIMHYRGVLRILFILEAAINQHSTHVRLTFKSTENEAATLKK